ncbi:ABC-F family ATP-binding cassette domain-containing protein [bacterium]|nr:MAG: ABC-F family ATP-binding cassette domain-containing protein [bacterium]
MLSLSSISKTISSKLLFENLTFQLGEVEKVALIGRNGIGKTTLFRLITEEDKDYSGEISKSRDYKIIKTEQEFFLDHEITPLDYILNFVPKYRELHKVMKDYELDPSHDMDEITKFSDAIEEFHSLNFSQIDNEIIQTLESFGINMEQSLNPMMKMSGGEKRFVELCKVIYSQADIVLIDEPTNHMDYVGKEKFIAWLKSFKKLVIVITHDRDILQVVDKIIELTPNGSKVFSGNYDKYIKQNSISNVSDINSYKTELDKIERLKELYLNFRKIKQMVASPAARTSAAKKEERYYQEYLKAKAELVKPEFWIDQESLLGQSKKVLEDYDKFKSKSINFKSFLVEDKSLNTATLIKIQDLTLGFGERILTKNLNFQISMGDKVEIRGRNGAGKSTFLKYIINSYSQNKIIGFISGKIELHPKLKVGVYEQEIDNSELELTLAQIIRKLYDSENLAFNDQELSRVLANYLFDPILDKGLKLKSCSGGQKARIQLIKMLISNPNILILDEPTNHLDLSSIEEFESMLKDYQGAVLYVSHDNYFRKNMGGKVVEF